jgi:hypothetical protein
VERARQEAIARQEAMVEDLRKAELVRDRLESLSQSAKAYPEGHDMRVLIEGLHIDRAPPEFAAQVDGPGCPLSTIEFLRIDVKASISRYLIMAFYCGAFET